MQRGPSRLATQGSPLRGQPWAVFRTPFRRFHFGVQDSDNHLCLAEAKALTRSDAHVLNDPICAAHRRPGTQGAQMLVEPQFQTDAMPIHAPSVEL